ncbi:MAG: DUF2085 domain-containing protein [Ignavibacteriales bacterium]|nr:DUF2085 domain-containing protein [Ignavibacteriales bacterium]
MKHSTAYYFLLGGAFVWCLLLFLPQFAALSDASLFANQSYKIYSKICHQYDSHSLHLFGEKLAVCARCSTTYFGFLFGVILSPVLIKRFSLNSRWLFIALVPMLLDVIGGWLGVHDSTLVTRTITGLLFGVATGIILTPYFIKGCVELSTTYIHNKKTYYESQT